MIWFIFYPIERGSKDPLTGTTCELCFAQIQLVLSIASITASLSCTCSPSDTTENCIVKCRHLADIAGGRDNSDWGEWVCKDKQLFPWWRSVTLPRHQGFVHKEGCGSFNATYKVRRLFRPGKVLPAMPLASRSATDKYAWRHFSYARENIAY